MNFEEYIPKLLYNESLYAILFSYEIDLMIDRYISHKSVAEIAFERSIRWTEVAKIIARAESKIIRYAVYIGDIT